jgi:hypothetical protein
MSVSAPSRLRRATFLGAALLAPTFAALPEAAACPSCRPAVQRGIFDGRFGERLAFVLAPFAATGLLGAAVVRTARRADEREGRAP